MGICKMAVIDRVDVDRTTTTVQLLLHRLGLKSKQGFEGTDKKAKLYLILDIGFVLAGLSQEARGQESEAANGFVQQETTDMAL